MNSVEAVDNMKQGKRVTHSHKTSFWYQLYHNGSVYSLSQDTACAARVLGMWDTTDEFIKSWNRTGGSRGPTDIQLYDGVD